MGKGISVRKHLFLPLLPVLTFLLIISAGAGMCSQPPAEQPQAASETYAAPSFTGVVRIANGDSVNIPAIGVSRVMVGATNIVSADRKGSQIVLRAKQPGTTVVKLWDGQGASTYQVAVVPRGESVPMATVGAAGSEVVEVNLQPGESYVIKGQKITRTSVSDPATVDIVPVSQTEVLVNAKKEGIATVRVWEGDASTTYSVKVARPLPPAEKIVEAILSEVQIDGLSASMMGETVVLRGTAPSADAAEKALQIAQASGRKVLSMIKVETVSPETVIASIKAALKADQLTYEVLPDDTVMIRGGVANEEEANRVMQVLAAWISSEEKGGDGKQAASAQINLTGAQTTEADSVDKARTAAGLGDVSVSEEYNFARRVFSGRVANGPKIVCTLDINPSLAKQILVSANVLEVNRTKLKALGLQWKEIFGETPTSPLVILEEWATPVPLDRGGPFRRSSLSASIKALVDERAARVLSEPKVLIIDGRSAQILVGGEIPIPVAQSMGVGSTTISVIYKPYGINLTVRPKVTADGQIYMVVTPEVSSIDESNTVEAAGIKIPATKVRRATTAVHMKDGQSLAIGGLLSSEDVKIVRSVPLLSKIPVIGELFKSRDFQKNETELIILVTPTVIAPGEPAPINEPK